MEGCRGNGFSQPVASVTRIECFSACHRLHSPSLSDGENAQVYGKCNNPNGHGHNYKLEVTVRGPVDPDTGMVINITALKSSIQRQVLDELDHKNLDKDVSHFRNKVSTTENLAVFIWQRLRDDLPEQLHLQVRLHETDKNVVTYQGPHECDR
ncbi:6-pyruvoyl tetrahydrobiopterin synthase [Ixodes scapularis]|uniref:6-pyruvoyl tetrahydrobiopterin synthase n=1 Tax=Ixodes scapularis TaxID=6945 RepID=UPI001C38BA96|nr:6-pyruvoyl tetrahydrobiopterin synthase [Ixodes scapularis]